MRGSRGGPAPFERRPLFIPEVESARLYYVRLHIYAVCGLALLLGIVVRATAAEEASSFWASVQMIGTELYDLAFGVDYPGLPQRHGFRYYLSTKYLLAALFGERGGAGEVGTDGVAPPSSTYGLFRGPGGDTYGGPPRMGLFPSLAYGVYDSLPTAATMKHLVLRAAVVTAGVSVYRWGVKVGGGVPKLWELRLAFEKMMADLEGKTPEEQKVEETKSKAAAVKSSRKPARATRA